MSSILGCGSGETLADLPPELARHRVLDAAAVHIVEMSAPFAPFPPDIKRDTDILHITRTWSFTKGDQLKGE